MKARLELGVVAAFVLAASAASAETPKYGDLPKSAFSSPPDDAKKPASIPAREKTEGFFIGAPKFDKSVPINSRHVTVFGTQAQADAMTKGDFAGVEDDGSVCFAETSRNGSSPSNADDDDDDIQQDWETSQQSQVHLWLKTKDNPSSGVGAVHSERVVEKDGAATLESVDAWVDPNTKGVRLIAKSSLPMKLMGTAMGDFNVYAARDERSGAKKRVQFVFVRSADQNESVRNQGMMATLSDGMGSVGSGCRHLRVSLPVQDKGGESAVITAMLELPSANPDEKKMKDAENDPPENAKKAKPNAGRFVGHRSRSLAGSGEKEIRLRQLEAHISVSKSTRDKEPIVSVSFGWASREATQRVFDSEE